MALELRHWRAFATAAETLHFGLAAERIGLTQPALSQLIKVVEDEFEVRLFDRSHRTVALTEAGRSLLPEAQAVLAQSRRAERLGLVAGRSSNRTLAIGYVGSAALHPFFSRLVEKLTTISPPLVLRLDQSPVGRQVTQVRDHNLDIGILRSPMPPLDPEIATLSLQREPIVLAIGRQSHHSTQKGPCNLADFAEEPFLQYRQQEGGGLYFLTQNACEQAGFQPRISQTVPQIATMLALVGAGLGVALIPESVSRLGVPGVVCRRLLQPVFTDFNLIYRRSDTAPALREALQAARAIDKLSL